MLGRFRNSFVALTVVLGFALSSGPMAKANLLVVAHKCEEDGKVTIILGDNQIGLSFGLRITVDGTPHTMSGEIFQGPAIEDLGDVTFSGNDYDSAKAAVKSWRTVTITLADGEHTIGHVTPKEFDDQEVLLPWTTTIDCEPDEVDTDMDGIPDSTDPDDDNDLVLDEDDDFPLDPTETTDTDGDGIGDNADLDDDGDGISDLQELEDGTDPLLADTDGDGLDDGEDPFPTYKDVVTLDDLAIFIRDITLHPDSIPDSALKHRRLRRPLRRRLSCIVILIRWSERTNDQDFSDFLVQLAIGKIEYCLLPKTDGSNGGDPGNDWVIDPDAAELLYGDLAFLSELLQERL